MSRRPKPLLVFKLTKQDNDEGTYAFFIGAKHLRLKSSANASVYKLCDIVERFPEVVNCNGVNRQLTVVLKIYAKIPQMQLKKQRELRRLAKLVKEGRWELSD